MSVVVVATKELRISQSYCTNKSCSLFMAHSVCYKGNRRVLVYHNFMFDEKL